MTYALFFIRDEISEMMSSTIKLAVIILLFDRLPGSETVRTHDLCLISILLHPSFYTTHMKHMTALSMGKTALATLFNLTCDTFLSEGRLADRACIIDTSSKLPHPNRFPPPYLRHNMLRCRRIRC